MADYESVLWRIVEQAEADDPLSLYALQGSLNKEFARLRAPEHEKEELFRVIAALKNVRGPSWSARLHNLLVVSVPSPRVCGCVPMLTPRIGVKDPLAVADETINVPHPVTGRRLPRSRRPAPAGLRSPIRLGDEANKENGAAIEQRARQICSLRARDAAHAALARWRVASADVQRTHALLHQRAVQADAQSLAYQALYGLRLGAAWLRRARIVADGVHAATCLRAWRRHAVAHKLQQTELRRLVHGFVRWRKAWRTVRRQTRLASELEVQRAQARVPELFERWRRGCGMLVGCATPSGHTERLLAVCFNSWRHGSTSLAEAFRRTREARDNAVLARDMSAWSRAARLSALETTAAVQQLARNFTQWRCWSRSCRIDKMNLCATAWMRWRRAALDASTLARTAAEWEQQHREDLARSALAHWATELSSRHTLDDLARDAELRRALLGLRKQFRARRVEAAQERAANRMYRRSMTRLGRRMFTRWTGAKEHVARMTALASRRSTDACLGPALAYWRGLQATQAGRMTLADTRYRENLLRATMTAMCRLGAGAQDLESMALAYKRGRDEHVLEAAMRKWAVFYIYHIAPLHKAYELLAGRQARRQLKHCWRTWRKKHRQALASFPSLAIDWSVDSMHALELDDEPPMQVYHSPLATRFSNVF